jgi:VWFA-related protein
MKKFVGLVVLIGLSAAAFAQQPASGAGQEPLPLETRPIVVRTDLVNVLFTATDKKNRTVLNLTKDDIKVFEDQRPQVIENFSRESDLPLRIAILIDSSTSVRDRLRFEQEAAIDFLTATIRPGKDQAFVVSFDNEPQLLQDYTDDVEKLAKAIRSLQAGGGTALFEAIYFSAKEKMIFFPPPEPYLRRVMIVVSDGEDNFSERTREEALAMAQRGEVTIFTISTNRSSSARPGDKVLKYLASETGGQAFFPFAASDLAGDFRQIARELRSQYSLAYYSTNKAQDGTFRTITVVPNDKDLKIRAKTGYFAPSPQ